jgi:hypothetical protein
VDGERNWPWRGAVVPFCVKRRCRSGCLTKAIVAVADTLVNKGKGQSEGLSSDVLCIRNDTMHCSSHSDFGIWLTRMTFVEMKA